MFSFNQPKFSTFGFDMNEVAGGDYGVHTKTMRTALKEVLKDASIPTWTYDNDIDYPRPHAFVCLHNPHKKENYNNALKRLKFDELLLLQLAMLKRRQQIRSGGAEVIEI